MRVEERCKSFCPQKRSIARNDKRQLRASANRATRDLHGVPCAALRLLQNCLRAKLGNDGAYFLRLVSYDNKQLRWFEWQASAHDVLDERESPGAMQDFRQLGTHARPFAGSQQYDCGVFCDHLADIVASSRSFSNRNSGTL